MHGVPVKISTDFSAWPWILHAMTLLLLLLLQYYLCGDWSAAKVGLEACLHKRTNASGQQIEDGPSRTLLEVMAAHGNQAPAGWNGVRELTEK